MQRLIPSLILPSLVVALVGGGARSAHAQTPPAAPPATPPAPHWMGEIMGSPLFLLEFGPTRQTMFALNGGLELAKPNVSYSFDGDYNHTTVTAQGAPSLTVNDAQHLSFTFHRTLTARTYLAVRPAFDRNAVLSIDHHFDELVGYGIILIKGQRGSLHVTPIAGATQQQKHVPAVDGASATAGVLQISSFRVGEMWHWQESLLWLENFKDSHDYRLQFAAGLSGKIKGPLSMQLRFSSDRNNIVAEGSDKAVSQLTVGLGLNFP